jgi:glucose/arabinose dehydrogenase
VSRFLLALSTVLIAGCANADAQKPFAVEAIAEFDEPWAMAFLPDGRLLVTEKAGRLLVVDGAGIRSQPVDGVPDVDYGGQGGPVISPGGFMVYDGELFSDWYGDGFIAGLSSKSLVRIEFEGDVAREAERFDMGRRMRAVVQGPDGAIWMLEDKKGGRLLRLTPKKAGTN